MKSSYTNSVEMPFGDKATFELVPGVKTAQHVDGITGRHPKTGAYFSFNGTGVFVWELICQGRSLCDVKLAAIEQFSVTREATDTNVDSFVGDLVGEGLLIPKSILEERDR